MVEVSVDEVELGEIADLVETPSTVSPQTYYPVELKAEVNPRSETVDVTSFEVVKAKQPKVARARTKEQRCVALKLFALAAAFLGILIDGLIYLSDDEKNSITTSKYVEFGTMQSPVFALFWVKKAMQCEVSGITIGGIGGESQSIERVEDHYAFAYNESITNWAHIGSYDFEDLGLVMTATIVAPPFDYHMSKQKWTSINVQCTLINDTHVPSENDEYADADDLQKTYWDDITQLLLNGWYNLYTSPIYAGRFTAETTPEYGYTSGKKFETIFERKLPMSMVDLATMNSFILDQTIIVDQIDDWKKTLYSASLKSTRKTTKMVNYNNDTQQWVIDAKLWFLPNSDNLKLKVTTRNRKSAFDVIASVGGFMSPMAKATNALFAVLISGVVISMVGLRVPGYAEDAPLNPNTERKIDSFLKRKDVVTRKDLEEILKQYGLQKEL